MSNKHAFKKLKEKKELRVVVKELIHERSTQLPDIVALIWKKNKDLAVNP